MWADLLSSCGLNKKVGELVCRVKVFSIQQSVLRWGQAFAAGPILFLYHITRSNH